jgi:eukaryotic-like serine/threonine-protein kinase
MRDGRGGGSSVHSVIVETAVADPLTGTVLDRRYRVGARIARGGMSVVYAGIDLRLDRQVAIKVMDAGLARDPVFVERFSREARAAARLAHVNAVAVYDQGTDGGHVFLVMELVRGRTLRELLGEHGRLPAEAAVSVLEPVLAVLAAAHRLGLVHRDVKPENVLLSDDGVIKVADFGLVRAVAAGSTSTQSGVVFGTAGYLAPEQVAHGRADPRSDVYSAGILLYELLTGSAPYTGDSAVAVAYRHVHDDVPAPSRTVPGLPPELDQLVLRATRRNPDARPADAGAFLAELAGIRAALGLRRVPMPIRTGRPPRALPAPDGSTPRAGQPVRVGPPPGGDRPGADRSTWGGWAGPAAGAGAAAAGAGAAGGGPRATAALPRLAAGQGRPGGAGWRPPARRNEQRAHRRRLIVGLLAVLVLGAMAAGASWWYGSGRFVAVPPLAGLTQQQAVTQATAAHLRVRFGAAEFSATVAAGRVIRTDPGAGDLVRRDSTILVLPSRGVAPVRVPEVVGQSRDDAQRAITRAGLKATVTEQFSATVPEGSVISQQPRGRAVPRGSTVALVVSKGPDLVRVPRVIGQSVGDATATLEQQGFTVQRHDFLGGVLGRVVRQNPGGGKRVARGATVTLDVF